jgi:hypothetical protein
LALLAVAPAAVVAQGPGNAGDARAQGLGDAPPASVEAPDWTPKLATTVTVGVGIRTRSQSAALVPGGSGNYDDGDLNYGRGDFFSGVAKAYAKGELLHRSKLGVTVSGVAWHDDVQLHHGVAHGNNANDFMPGAALSDNGFASGGRFRGALLLDMYAHGTSSFVDETLQWRIGRLTLERERGLSIPGPRREIETRNFAALFRPGAIPEESQLPIYGATARWNLTPAIRLDAFWQFATERSVEPGCGTFFEFSDYTADGCNRIFYTAALPEQRLVAAGVFAPRSADVRPTDRPDQFGVAFTYVAREIGTRFGVEYAHYHSRDGIASAVKGSGLGPKAGTTYALDYASNKSLLSVTTATFVPDSHFVWINEASAVYRRQVGLNGDDLIRAFLTGTGPLGADAIATPPNSLYHGYDRFTVYQLGSGATKEFVGVLGATASSIGVEIGLKSVPGLPPVTVRRYGRPSGASVCPTPASCATDDGYVTRNAWAYRLRGALSYAAANGVNWKPSLALAHDVRGWSYDYLFVQGRKTALLALDADFGGKAFANVSYVVSRGGQFNSRKNLDYVMASTGARF